MLSILSSCDITHKRRHSINTHWDKYTQQGHKIKIFQWTSTVPVFKIKLIFKKYMLSNWITNCKNFIFIYRLKQEIRIWHKRTSEFTNTMYLSKNLPVVNRIKSFLSHVCLFSSQWMQKVLQRNDQLLWVTDSPQAYTPLNPIKSLASNLPLKELHGIWHLVYRLIKTTSPLS